MTPDERKDRQRGWLTLLAVALLAATFFLALWLFTVGLFFSDPGPSID